MFARHVEGLRLVSGVRYSTVALDQFDSVGAAISEVGERFGHIDIVFNNAGIGATGGGMLGLRTRPPRT